MMKICYVHLLVLEAFVGPRPDGLEGCHNDGNPDNNRLDNLRWDTPESNQADRIAHGTDIRGIKNGQSKLTEEDISAIRREYVPRVKGSDCRALASKYGVSHSLIAGIVRNKTWRHVT
ncbi:HNH endonuclease [Mesorhizobium sp. M7A.F.Ca.AU.002.06.1.1]|uniref:HNH endonuclease signature motif containing protein n=1 Tax=Mesorhizobium ciceri TaxID=39645 RepID=UPI000FCAA9BD|nr:HNH endonuclease [Mesorhizobium sp. Primo-B]RUU38029.1 HNH endonuclease [Mesorhizobium sp. Primo-A]RVB63092.1 HNH endonuclease [Mesorhizobium sp. M7A.F.Ca.CA.002.03.2.1]RVB91113.1 HNH endonuclease [Mesorhizobium sp. M7A.F.Ca.AU.002.03.1.1]RVB96066.1 HNH endonuclease [Mesorhizobium sp. M7A.F.Ca.AU.002.04.1.1]RVC05848.1 HNH endonuclease [Mesorhizobium sp. M7A.F.Ca.AU.002.06.1.1]RVC19411.1 HNH endonuclease [Mesorhizobium sp. M7A.F.Ca.AU.001.01.1.1]RVC26741.1 HNH endonuclease [Mesorhizobium s